jgi:hypothetical protein
MTQENPVSSELEALFVDSSEQAIDGLLRNALEPYIGFTRDSKIVTKAPFLKLADNLKLLAYLLARQAMVRLQLTGAVLAATAEHLATECHVPIKSAREHLSRLKGRRLLEKDDSGYFVPTWAISSASEALQKGS